MRCLSLRSSLPSVTIQRWKHRLNHPGVHIPHGVQYKKSHQLPDEYADHPLYPAIRPKYPPGSWGTMDPRMAWKHNELGEKYYRHLKCVKERLTIMAYQNMMCYYDELDVEQIDSKLIWMLSGRPRAPRALPFYKYITRTHVTDELPKFYNQIDVQSLLDYVKPILIDRILTDEYAQKEDIPLEEMQENGAYPVKSILEEKKLQMEQRKSINVLTKIVRTIVNVLAEHKPHLRRALVKTISPRHRKRIDLVSLLQIGSDVPIEAWWSSNLNGEKYDRAKWHHDQNTTSFQFRDKAAVQVKTDRPLRSVNLLLHHPITFLSLD